MNEQERETAIENAVAEVGETIRDHPLMMDGTPAEALEFAEALETDLDAILAGLRDDVRRNG